MKTLPILLCSVLLYYATTRADTVNPSKIMPEPQYEKIAKLEQKICDSINDRKTAIDRIAFDIQKMEKLTQDFPRLFVREMLSVVGSFQNRGEEEQAAALLARKTIEKSAFLSFERDRLQTYEMMEIQENQIQILLMPEYRFKKSDTLIDCHSASRKRYAERLLALYQTIICRIDENYDPNAEKNQIVTNGFTPPDSYIGQYNSGQDMSNVEDKATREAYKAYLEEQHQKVNKRNEQATARKVQKRFTKDIQTYLIDAYSMFPYRTSELETILKEKRVDSMMVKEILDVVQNTEKENPDKGFRIWLSNDKMFKTTAKFISLDKGGVTLERADGKRTTMELAELRQEDKDYVNNQLATKATEPVVMRTWTSSGGKYRIRAEYVSADENQVMLKNEEGKIFPVALPKLSTDDQNYVKEQLAAKPELLKRGK